MEKKSAVVDTESYWAPEINKPSDISTDKLLLDWEECLSFPLIPSCKVPLALKRSVAAHGFLNKIYFNEGYLSGPNVCRSNLETFCIYYSAVVNADFAWWFFTKANISNLDEKPFCRGEDAWTQVSLLPAEAGKVNVVGILTSMHTYVQTLLATPGQKANIKFVKTAPMKLHVLLIIT